MWPLAEPPRSYVLFSAMAMLGACIGRRIYFDQDVHRIYPLTNLLLIGPSGIGKSTSLVDMALDQLVLPLPLTIRPQVITGKSTKEALHEDLMASPHSIIVASELANLFSKERYQEGMIPYMTDLLDLRPTRVRTKVGREQVIEQPSVSVMGGSTKEWLQDQLPSSAGAGGFLPRFLIVKEDYKFQRVPDPKRVLSPKRRTEIERQRVLACNKFAYLVGMHTGLVDFEDYAASDVYALWYQTQMPETGHLSPFSARAGVHVIRMAMLLAISCGRTSILASDLRCAINMYEYTAKKLQEVVVPMSPQGKLINKVLEAIGDDSVSDVQVRRAMRNYCSASDTDKMIASLISSRDVAVIDGKIKRVGR